MKTPRIVRFWAFSERTDLLTGSSSRSRGAGGSGRSSRIANIFWLGIGYVTWRTTSHYNDGGNHSHEDE